MYRDADPPKNSCELFGEEMKEIIRILIGFLKLDGEKIIDKLYVYRSKFFYLLYIVFLVTIFRLPPTHIGSFLTRDIIAKNSYGKFYCREKEEDLGIVSEYCENRTLSIFRNLAKNAEVIIDVGANVGKYTVLASKFSKATVIAMEASRKNFLILKKNLQLNKCKNVLAINMAATKSNRKVKLYKGATGGQYTLRPANSAYEVVNGIALDSLLKKLGIRRVDLIKIDVEGSELDVIEGLKQYLTSHRVENMIVEIWKENYNKLKEKLTPLGYSFKRIERNNYLIKYDGIIVNNSKN